MNESNEPPLVIPKFKSASEEIHKAAQSTADAVKNVGNVAKEEAHTALSKGKEHLEKAGQNFKEGALETLEALREEGKEYVKEATTAVQNLQSRSENYIRAHPFTSIFITLGIGCLLTAILKHRCRNSN
jgi:ElaB/YqjD/DUF883 family membrane-anchored ribosome-binding protein